MTGRINNLKEVGNEMGFAYWELRQQKLIFKTRLLKLQFPYFVIDTYKHYRGAYKHINFKFLDHKIGL